MPNKERLDLFKKQRRKKTNALDYIDLDVDWAIIRIEELEAELEFANRSRSHHKEQFRLLDDDSQYYIKRYARYREALNEIIKYNNYRAYVKYIACQALEGEEE